MNANFVKLIENSKRKKYMKRALLMKESNEQMKSGRGPITNLKVSTNMGTAIITKA